MPICVAVKAMFSSAVAILRVVVSSTFEASMDYAFVLAFVAAGDIDFALRAKWRFYPFFYWTESPADFNSFHGDRLCCFVRW